MTTFDPLLVIVNILNFLMLANSRLRGVVLTAAVQGALLGLWPLVMHEDLGPRTLFLALATVVIKGFVIPRMMFFAMREVSIRREVEPVIGFGASVVLQAIGTALALLFAGTLPLAGEHVRGLEVPTALATVFAGFLILITRRNAFSQVLGYLVLENGIFVFGMLLLEAMPLLVELGVLLDLFVAIFVMGIIINHISREFSSESSEYLSALRE